MATKPKAQELQSVRQSLPKPVQKPILETSPQTEQEPLHLLLQRAQISPESVSSSDANRIQRSIGNQAVGQLLNTPTNEHAVSSSPTASLQRMLASRGIQTEQLNDRSETMAQRNLLQHMAAQSHPHNSQVIQRVIEIKGDKVYGAGEADALKDKYPTEWKDILYATSEFGFAPKTIEDALADKRHYTMTRDEDPEYGVFWSAELAAVEKEVKGGGKTREAGEKPVLVLRPKDNFEELKIAGLIMCVGIVIEARNEDGIQAAAGSHFVTPTSIEKGTINEQGLGPLVEQIKLVEPYGTLTATLMPTEGASTQKTGAQRDAYEAVQLLAKLLQSLGVKQVDISEGDSTRYYQLLANGTSTLK